MTRHPFEKPEYPMKASETRYFARGDELGHVAIQVLDEDHAKVSSFLPGREEWSPGDTPKTWPEKHTWTSDRLDALHFVDVYHAEALAAGWLPVQPGGR